MFVCAFISRLLILFISLFSFIFFFFSSRRRHTRLVSDWSSDVCSSDLWGFYSFSHLFVSACHLSVLIHTHTHLHLILLYLMSSFVPFVCHFIVHIQIGRASCRERV